MKFNISKFIPEKIRRSMYYCFKVSLEPGDIAGKKTCSVEVQYVFDFSADSKKGDKRFWWLGKCISNFVNNKKNLKDKDYIQLAKYAVNSPDNANAGNEDNPDKYFIIIQGDFNKNLIVLPSEYEEDSIYIITKVKMGFPPLIPMNSKNKEAIDCMMHKCALKICKLTHDDSIIRHLITDSLNIINYELENCDKDDKWR